MRNCNKWHHSWEVRLRWCNYHHAKLLRQLLADFKTFFFMQFSPLSVPISHLLQEITKQNHRHLTLLQEPAQVRSPHLSNKMNEMWKNSMRQCNKNNSYAEERGWEGQGEALNFGISQPLPAVANSALLECKLLDIGKKKKKKQSKSRQPQHPSQVLSASLLVQSLTSPPSSTLLDLSPITLPSQASLKCSVSLSMPISQIPPPSYPCPCSPQWLTTQA